MLHLRWILCIALLGFGRQRGVPFLCKASSDEEYIALLKCDIALFRDLQDGLESDLMILQRRVLHPVLLSPRCVVNEYTTPSDALFRPVLHADPRVAAILYLCACRTAVENSLLRALSLCPRYSL